MCVTSMCPIDCYTSYLCGPNLKKSITHQVHFLFSMIQTPSSKTLMAILQTSIGSHVAQDVELSNSFMLTSVALLTALRQEIISHQCQHSLIQAQGPPWHQTRQWPLVTAKEMSVQSKCGGVVKVPSYICPGIASIL